jgi:tripartite-type tricarboxylate transporter receptor subunit TctC
MQATLGRLVLSVLMLALLPAAHTQTFPAKPIRLVVGFPPGTATDTVARQIAERLSMIDGWSVIVDNRVGQAGSVGAYEVARAAPDGHTLLISANGPLATNPSLYANVRYDIARDFAPVGQVGVLPYVMVVNASNPWRGVGDVLAAARAQPEKFNYASSGNGSTAHLIAAMFARQTGTRFTHVPYKGSAESMTGVLSGQVDLLFDTSVATVPQVRAGKLRALAVTTAKRIGTLPDTPTVTETGMANFDMAAWLGIVAPAGTPQPVIRQLNNELVRVLGNPALKEKLTRLGAEVSPSSPEEFGAYLKSELVKWAQAVKESGAKVE